MLTNIIAHLEPITRGNLVATARRARLVFQQVYPAHPPVEYQLHPSHPSPPAQIDDLPVRLDPDTRPGYIRLIAPEDSPLLPQRERGRG